MIGICWICAVCLQMNFTVLFSSNCLEILKEFPAESVDYVITSPPNGIALDPFAATGTTLVASLKKGRRAVGIEISPIYLQEAQAWLETVTAKTG